MDIMPGSIEEKVLDVIRDSPDITFGEIWAKLNSYTRTNIMNILHNLKKCGKISGELWDDVEKGFRAL